MSDAEPPPRPSPLRAAGIAVLLFLFLPGLRDPERHKATGAKAGSSGLRIRSAEAGDARSIARVHVLSWQFSHRGLFSDEVVDGLAVEERERAWQETLENPTPGKVVFVAEGEAEVVAFASAGPSRDPFAEPETGEVYEIFVHPEIVGTGVGEALLQETLYQLKRQRFRSVTLWVVEGNERARRFYERLGLRPDGSTKTAEMSWAEAVEVRYKMILD